MYIYINIFIVVIVVGAVSLLITPTNALNTDKTNINY